VSEPTLDAQKALLESEERYRTLFESIDEGFCVVEMIFDGGGKPVDYRFLEINPSFEEQTGLKNAHGKTMRELAPTHEEHWFQTYGKIALTGEPIRFQNRAEQLHRTYDVYAFRFGAPEKRQVAILFNDISKRVQAQAALEEANKELEAFSFSVSHDLRAPLRHVQGYIELLKGEMKGQLSEKAQRYMETVSGAARKMSQLIEDLLGFSRMGRAAMTQSAVDPNVLVQRTRHELEHAIGGRNINWKVSPLPMVHADPAMLQLVFANLIGNAVKYSRKRDPAEIEIGSAGMEGGRHVFFVRDNGAGFDMSNIERLFGVFQRLHGVDEFEGTGIGLANVRRIVARHGGRTWAEGKTDAGATFYFTVNPAI
jgi:PAS domain S-box-containing protein